MGLACCHRCVYCRRAVREWGGRGAVPRRFPQPKELPWSWGLVTSSGPVWLRAAVCGRSVAICGSLLLRFVGLFATWGLITVQVQQPHHPAVVLTSPVRAHGGGGVHRDQICTYRCVYAYTYMRLRIVCRHCAPQVDTATDCRPCRHVVDAKRHDTHSSQRDRDQHVTPTSLSPMVLRPQRPLYLLPLITLLPPSVIPQPPSGTLQQPAVSPKSRQLPSNSRQLPSNSRRLPSNRGAAFGGRQQFFFGFALRDHPGLATGQCTPFAGERRPHGGRCASPSPRSPHVVRAFAQGTACSKTSFPTISPKARPPLTRRLGPSASISARPTKRTPPSRTCSPPSTTRSGCLVGGSRRLAVGGPSALSLWAVLQKKRIWLLKDRRGSPPQGQGARLLGKSAWRRCPGAQPRSRGRRFVRWLTRCNAPLNATRPLLLQDGDGHPVHAGATAHWRP